MPPEQQYGGAPGQAARATSKFITFNGWERLNTQSVRQALKETELAQLENLQPIAANNLVSVPGPAAALTTITGKVIKRKYFANIGSIDYIIAFTTDGAGTAINAVAGTQTVFAPAGTFANPDMTQWQSERILIIDPNGYSSWDTFSFARQGTVSPRITVTAGGTNYSPAPTVAITGGTGTGATAHAVVDSTGTVVKVVLDSAGTGFLATDTLTVTFSGGGGGSGATATARVFPFGQFGTTLAVFQGRVWFGNGRVLTYTGTVSYDDFNAANASASQTIPDADLVHQITALRALNGALFIMGDNSVKQIGNITVSGTSTLFQILTLSSDQGTTFLNTVQSYSRLVLFANKNGVFAILGASVQKISDDLDGIFQLVDFSQEPMAALNDLRNIHCYLILLRYLDPVAGPRSIIAGFMNKKWFVISQGDNLQVIVTAALATTGRLTTFGSSGADVTQLLQDLTATVNITLQTSLSNHGNMIQAKQAIRAGVGVKISNAVSLSVSLDSETMSNNYNLAAAVPVTWLNASGQIVTWQNSALQTVVWSAQGYRFPYRSVDGYGKMLGLTITGAVSQFALTAAAIEYQENDLWGESP